MLEGTRLKTFVSTFLAMNFILRTSCESFPKRDSPKPFATSFRRDRFLSEEEETLFVTVRLPQSKTKEGRGRSFRLTENMSNFVGKPSLSESSGKFPGLFFVPCRKGNFRRFGLFRWK